MEAEEIRALRKRLGMSQEEFAQLMGVTVATVSNWERGRNPISRTRIPLLERLASGGLQQVNQVGNNIGTQVAENSTDALLRAQLRGKDEQIRLLNEQIKQLNSHIAELLKVLNYHKD